MPELPEVETIRRQLAPYLEGRRLERLAVLDPRWCDPAEPAALEDAARGRRIERLDRRGKYLVLELEDEVLSRDAPAHDRQPAAGTGRERASSPARHSQPRFGRARAVRGRAPLRDRDRAARRGRARGLLQRPPRRRAAQPGLHGRGAARGRPRAARAGEGVPALPGADRRGGEHLRGRGALPRAHPPAAPGRHAQAAPAG